MVVVNDVCVCACACLHDDGFDRSMCNAFHSAHSSANAAIVDSMNGTM